MSRPEIIKKQWVLVCVLKETTQDHDLNRIAPQIENLVDEWHLAGKIMWSGPFDDNKTAMTIFEATEQEAKDFLSKYGNACSDVLDYYMYQWDAMPVLSLLTKN